MVGSRANHLFEHCIKRTVCQTVERVHLDNA